MAICLYLILLLGGIIPLKAQEQLLSSHQLTPLGTEPHWDQLQKYANTMSAHEMQQLLNAAYVPDHSWKEWIHFSKKGPSSVTINCSCLKVPKVKGKAGPFPKQLTIPLAATSTSQRTKQVRFEDQVHPFWGIPRLSKNREKPLQGIIIALDPGHLGGHWAKMEERWFRFGRGKPIKEGELTWKTALILQQQLESLGAKVVLTKKGYHPVTERRPYQLKKTALATLKAEKRKVTSKALRQEEEKLFYRTAEIRARSRIVNQKLQPHLVICLHYDAEEWYDPQNPSLVNKEKMHILLPGAYAKSELAYEDERYEMLEQLFSRTYNTELSLGNAVARSMAKETAQPPFVYHSRKQAILAKVGNPYLWHRNLLANRLMKPPVIYVESYVMNNPIAYQRIQMGDYLGERMVAGHPYRSIYREYATGVSQGVVNYFSHRKI
jgi:N-acetylmuramoyl-L-alanine amidase